LKTSSDDGLIRARYAHRPPTTCSFVQLIPTSQDVFFTEYYEDLLAAMRKVHSGRTIQCYEAFMVHLAVVPFVVILDHLEGITKTVRAGLDS
jgi:hypothetical protein